MANMVFLGGLYLGFAILSVVLCIPPLACQARSRNFPVIVLITTTIILNIQNASNALIWPSWQENAWDGRILCDIEVRFYAAMPVAAAGAVACILRQLANALRTDRVGASPSKRQRIRTWALDLTLCVVFPVITIATLHRVSLSRYKITRVLGCSPSVAFTWTAIALRLLWQPISTLIAVGYGGIIMFRLVRHRRNVSSVLAASGTNKDRHVRLLILSLGGLFLVLLPSSFSLVLSLVRRPLDLLQEQEHPSAWAEEIGRLPWSAIGVDRLIFQCAQVATGIPIFALLGTGRESYLVYKSMLPASARRIRTNHMMMSSGGTQPEASSDLRATMWAENTTEVSPRARGAMDPIDRELWLVDNAFELQGNRLGPGSG